ncbi:MAG: hypothetical protein ACLP3B_04570, partial [Syntrophobacteraceae bacterium]
KEDRWNELPLGIKIRAVYFLKGYIDDDIDTEFRDSHFNADDNVDWFAPYYGGLAIGNELANGLRMNVCYDDKVPSGNWDHYYVACIEAALGFRRDWEEGDYGKRSDYHEATLKKWKAQLKRYNDPEQHKEAEDKEYKSYFDLFECLERLWKHNLTTIEYRLILHILTDYDYDEPNRYDSHTMAKDIGVNVTDIESSITNLVNLKILGLSEIDTKPAFYFINNI